MAEQSAAPAPETVTQSPSREVPASPALRFGSGRSPLKSVHWTDLPGLRPVTPHPCLRFFMEPDEFRNDLGARLEALHEEWTGIPRGPPEPSPDAVAYLYRCLAEAEAEQRNCGVPEDLPSYRIRP